MSTPVISNLTIAAKGEKVELAATYIYVGNDALTLTYQLVDANGDKLGPFTHAIAVPEKILILTEVPEGVWKASVILTPANVANQSATLESPTLIKVSRAEINVVLPNVGGVAANSAPDASAFISDSIRHAYSEIVQSATANKRVAIATNIADALSALPVLRIFRNNEEIMRVKYAGKLIVATNGQNDVVLRTPTVQSVAVYKTADLNTGLWRFALQGFKVGELCEIRGTVGATGSGKQMILNESPAAGMGLASEFEFLIPRSIDNLT